LIWNEVQRVRHKNSINRGETEGGALQISHDLTNLHAVVLIRNSLQGSLVEINCINCAAGSQQLSQGNRVSVLTSGVGSWRIAVKVVPLSWK